MLLRLWQTFRLLFLIVLFVALTLFLIITTPWHRWFGSPPTYAGLIAQGQPLVAAITRFHNDCDLWPEYLDDLFPRYLSTRPAPEWYYTVTPDGPSLSTLTHERRTHVGYDFDPLHPAWRVFGEVDNRLLASPLPPLPPTSATPPSPEMILNNELAELDRRIAREPSVLEHRRGKASLLRSLGRMEDARSVLQQAETDLPLAAWPPLALAALNLTPASVETFAQWTRAHPGFTHAYDLSLLRRQLDDAPDALADIRTALTFPLRIAEDDSQTLAFYLWDMARVALRENDARLVLQVADAWDRARADGQIGENNITPLRAAAQLALGDDAAAVRTLRTFDTHPLSTWCVHLPELRAAITAQNHAFRYDPGPLPAAPEIFALPQ